ALRRALTGYRTDQGAFDFDHEAPLLGAARVVDTGDVAGDLVDGGANRAAIRRAVGEILAAGAVPLVLGGDDSVPIPVLQAFEDQPLTVVQIDAHIDWRDAVQGERFGYSSTMRRASELAQVEAIVQVGARGPGSARSADVDAARAWGADIVTAREVHRGGVTAVLDRIPRGRPLYLALDVDGLDPALVPGVLLPAFGGLGYTQMVELIHGLETRAPIAGVSVVEYVPAADPDGRGAQAVARLATNAIAAIARQRRR
ncbi:MAG: arginase family protein, partial [Alphaproteobacteria bacterium]